jgi:uncharacterized protein YlaI
MTPRTPARQITDRAKRYRANRNPPPGRKKCQFCASRKNVDIDHVSGHEADDSPANKMFLCRSCNTRKGIMQARNRIGTRTRQFNPQPAPSFAAYCRAARILVGENPGDVGAATATIQATTPERRAAFADRIAASNPAPTFEQYIHGVVSHQRGARDEGGAIIHATPPALRSRYAGEIAAIKQKRGTNRRPAREEVPF